MNLPENYNNEDFQHGLRSGAGNVDREMYEGYLSDQVSFEHFQARILAKKAEKLEVEGELDKTRVEQQQLFTQWQEHATEAEIQQKKIHRITDEQQLNDQQLNTAEAQKMSRTSPYALFAGILYLLSGIAFIVGDLIISHEIVAYALNIRNNVEAWTFAVGLASLSILLKPAYERLIEQPYLDNKTPKSQRIYTWFQSSVVVLSVVTMLILGWFRYEAYKTDKLKDGINKQIQAMQLDAQPIDPTQGVDNQALILKMDEKLQLYDDLNLALVNSPWALLSFVLSGVLFAIAGAICLGIAFPVLQTYWYRWLQISPKIKRIKIAATTLSDRRESTERLYFEALKKQRISENAMSQLTDVAVLRERITALSLTIEELENKCKKHDIDRRIYTYSNGYEMGKSNREQQASGDFSGYQNGLLN